MTRITRFTFLQTNRLVALRLGEPALLEAALLITPPTPTADDGARLGRGRRLGGGWPSDRAGFSIHESVRRLRGYPLEPHFLTKQDGRAPNSRSPGGQRGVPRTSSQRWPGQRTNVQNHLASGPPQARIHPPPASPPLIPPRHPFISSLCLPIPKVAPRLAGGRRLGNHSPCLFWSMRYFLQKLAASSWKRKGKRRGETWWSKKGNGQVEFPVFIKQFAHQGKRAAVADSSHMR